MSVTQLDYPVTGVEGSYLNVFPSHNPLNMNFLRRDVLISAIASGTNGVVELTLSNTLDNNLIVGDFVVWGTDGYSLRTSRILDIIDTVTIELDEVFTSTDNTNGFMNYRKNWYLEARFLSHKTATGAQTNVELLLEDFSQVPSSINGLVVLDLSVIRDILIPDFSLSTGISEGLSKMFKVQYRESYETNREGVWISPSDDIPIMLVLASQALTFNDFTDTNLTQGRYYKDYPLLFSYIYSDINDNGLATVIFTLNQYTLSKELIMSKVIGELAEDSGVFNILVKPSDIYENTVFMNVSITKVYRNLQYDSSQYDGTQYS